MQSSLRGDTEDTLQDSAKLILLSALKETQLNHIAQINDSFVYELKYEYKIYPNDKHNYKFEIRLPFDGIVMQNGSKVQLTVLIPSGAEVDNVDTKGIDENGLEIQELIQHLQSSNRSVVSFEYQLDPLFIINYRHNTPLYEG